MVGIINTIIKFRDLKPKDLVGIPWRVAFALQADGWYLRQDIIWHKPNPMPESVHGQMHQST
jgi:DNA modification methylase